MKISELIDDLKKIQIDMGDKEVVFTWEGVWAYADTYSACIEDNKIIIDVDQYRV